MNDEAALKRRARLGIIALGVRSALQNLVILVANVYLARLLTPADYGVFGILQFALALFRLVGDTGLGAALVQKKETPDDVELSSIWWLQLCIGVLLVLSSLAIAPILPWIWPTLTPSLALLLPGLSLSLLFTLMRAVPFLLLERQVNFGWIGLLEFLGTLAYYGTAVLLAHLEYGVTALVSATVAQSALISIVANFVQPWRPRFVFDKERVRHLLKFGFAFQGSNIAAFVNNALTPLLVGARLGADALGLVQFAQGTAWFPTHPVGIVRRVYFPYLSRLQHDAKAFARELDQATLLCAVPSCFFAALFFGGAPAIIPILYSAKWEPAIPLVYWFSAGFVTGFYGWIGSAALEALGQTRTLFRITVGTTLFNWAACAAVIWLYPTPLAFVIAFYVHLVLSPLATLLAVRIAAPQARSLRQMPIPLAAMVLVALLGRTLLPWITGAWTLVAWLLLIIVSFSGVVLALDKQLRALVLKRVFKAKRSETV